MFRELGFAPSLLVNTVLYETVPGLIEAFRSLGCAQAGLHEAAETALIREARDTIEPREGRPPRGWLGPRISKPNGRRSAARGGLRLVLDLAMDDQLVWLRTAAAGFCRCRILRTHDANAVVLRRNTGREFATMIVDQCVELLEHGGSAGGDGRRPARPCQRAAVPAATIRQALEHVQAQGAPVWIADTDRIATVWQSRATPELTGRAGPFPPESVP